ncbi:helix-turn-helix domain-containing protein [bacterium]|nr:helix-turn-helix domain-containing protein [bacterium]
MSPRHLTSVFKKETWITIKEYTHRLKFELAHHLMNNPKLTIDAISKECGFEDPRRFRHLWKIMFGRSPSVSRENAYKEISSLGIGIERQ